LWEEPINEARKAEAGIEGLLGRTSEPLPSARGRVRGAL